MDCILTDDQGNAIALVEQSGTGHKEEDSLQALYPGQPEKEDTSDETIPAGSEVSSEGKDGKHGDRTPKGEWTDGESDEDENKVIFVPEFITARDYILQRYRLSMYSYMNSLLRTGKLSGMVGFPFHNKVLNRYSMKLGFMSFWRIDRADFYADVSVRLILDTDHQRKKEWRGTLVLWCSFDDDLTCTVEYLERGTIDRGKDLMPLSPYLVPYLKNWEVDVVAENILKKYLPEAFGDPRSNNAYRLAERMGLEIWFLPVDDHKGIRSMLLWEDGELPVRDKDRPGQKEPEMVAVPANTIVVNTNEIKEEFASFCIYHECIHHPLHYMAYRLQKLASSDDKGIRYKKVRPEEGKPIVNPVFFMEKQANRGAYGLMMPESLTRPMILQRCREAGECKHAGERYDKAGKRMAWELMLPEFQIRARMIQLGHNQAKGALNYADKRPVEPFAFVPESWKDDQHTFVIDWTTVQYLMNRNTDLCTLITSGRYIYADGRVVRNTPRYVKERYVRGGHCRLVLTDWANAHVDECCLRFVRQYIQRSNGNYGYGRIYYDADYIRQTLFYLEDMMALEGLDEIDAKYKYRQEFPRTFRDAVNQLRKKRKITMEKLAEKLDTTAMTLSRWLAEPDRYVSLDFVVILCLILQLPDWISMMLLKRAHIQLDEDDRRHLAILHILRVQSNDGLEAANNYLKEKNLEILRL